MGVPFSEEVFNAREEILSADMMRAQQLISRDVQNSFRDVGRSDELIDASPAPDGFENVATQGTPFSAMDLLPSLAPVAASYDLTIEAGNGYAYLSSLSADDSNYQVLRWEAQDLTFAVPDGANYRIDLIVAEPASVQSDFASRNILLDPTLRTTAPQSVPKSQNPVATLTVVTGTPAATPQPPAVPAGKIAIFEILVPTAAADSTAFVPTRRIFRRSVSVMASYHGIISGCVPFWSEAMIPYMCLPGTTAILAGTSDTPYDAHRLVIDGEPISFGQGFALMLPEVDSSNSPFATGAGATTDMPYYIYLCGGRNNPQSYNMAPAAPAILVESLTPPDGFGRPTATMTTTRGTIQKRGAVYIGIGYVTRSSANRKCCYIEGDWVHARAYGASTYPGGFIETSDRTLTNAAKTFSLASRPAAISKNAQLFIAYSTGVAISAGSNNLSLYNNFGTYTNHCFARLFPYVQSQEVIDRVTIKLPATVGNEVKAGIMSNSAGATFDMYATAYSMGVKRLAP